MKLLRYLIFFPSATFSLYSAEVFPYALLYAILVIRKVSVYLVLIVLLSVLSILYGIYCYQNPDYFQIIRSWLAYLNPLLVFYALTRMNQGIIDKFHRIVKQLFIFLMILGFLQLSGILSPFEFLFKWIVPRASASALGFRGVTLLSTEPARAGIEMIFIYLYVRRFMLQPGKWPLFDIAAFVYITFIFKSATVLFLFCIFLIIFYSRKSIIYIPFLVVGSLIAIMFSEGRVAVLVRDLMALPFEESLWFISNTSGNRVISIYAAHKFAITNLFGGGIGFWKFSSVEALNLTGIDYTSMNYFAVHYIESRGGYFFRGSGYFTNLLMDTGYIGCSLVLLLMSKIKQSTARGLKLFTKEDGPFYAIFLINIAVVGSVGVPVPWAIAALYLRQHYQHYKVVNNG